MSENRQGSARHLLAMSEDVPPGAGLLRGALERGGALRRRPWRPRMRLLVAGAGAVAAVVAFGVTTALRAASTSDAPSALAAITGALAKTAAKSYSFSLDEKVKLSRGDVQSIVVSGGFDPMHELGTELLTTRVASRPVRAQIRFIGKHVYTRLSPGSGFGITGPPWDKAPVPPAGSADGTPGDDLYGFVTDRPVSPAELSGVLRSAGTARDVGSASGPGWTGTRYAFTAHLYGGRESVSATLYVDHQGRVRRLMTITTQGRRTTDRDLTFSYFGVAVPVTAPAASQVQVTSTPYWGFFF